MFGRTHPPVIDSLSPEERLLQALACQDVDAVRQALADGADPNAPLPGYVRTDGGPETGPPALHYLMEAFCRMRQEHRMAMHPDYQASMQVILGVLLDAGADLGVRNGAGVDLLTLAVKAAEPPLLDLLLQRGLSLHQADCPAFHLLQRVTGFRSYEEKQALLHALAGLLIHHGADPLARHTYGETDGLADATALEWALHKVDYTMVACLPPFLEEVGGDAVSGRHPLLVLAHSPALNVHSGPMVGHALESLLPALQQSWQRNPSAHATLGAVLAEAREILEDRIQHGDLVSPRRGSGRRDDEVVWANALAVFDPYLVAHRLHQTLDQTSTAPRIRERM